MQNRIIAQESMIKDGDSTTTFRVQYNRTSLDGQMTYMIPCFDEMGKYTSLQMQTDRQEIDDLLAYCRRLKLEVSCSLTKLHKDSGGVIMKYVYTIVGNGNALAFFKLRYIDQIAVIEEPDCAG